MRSRPRWPTGTSLGFEGLLGPLGSALAADSVTVWASRHAGLRALATWKPGRRAGDRTDRGCRSCRGLCVADRPGGRRPPRRKRPASSPERRCRPASGARLSDTHDQGVLAVVELRSASGLPISDTLTRVLESVGREVGAFFAVRPCPPDNGDCRHVSSKSWNSSQKGSPRLRSRRNWCSARRRSAPMFETFTPKLGVGDRVSAVVKAMRAGLIR